jgi:alpha-aminoadipate/glutamate carrier protein LysW
MPTVACPECHEDVFVDADSEQGDIFVCDECGVNLELVGLDPIEIDVTNKKSGNDDDYDNYNDYDDDGF